MRRRLLLSIVLLSSGCSLGSLVPTPTVVACAAALIEGTLERVPPDGLGIRTDDGDLTRISWREFTIEPGPPLEVFAPDGAVVAKEGDRVAVGGGFTMPDGSWGACGSVRVIGPGT